MSTIPTNVVRCQQYDKGIKIFLTIKKDGLIESIAGSTIFLGFKDYKNEVVYNRTMSITDPELAEVLYTLTAEDTSVPGTFGTEVEITYSNGVKLSVEDAFILVVTPEKIERV